MVPGERRGLEAFQSTRLGKAGVAAFAEELAQKSSQALSPGVGATQENHSLSQASYGGALLRNTWDSIPVSRALDRSSVA